MGIWAKIRNKSSIFFLQESAKSRKINLPYLCLLADYTQNLLVYPIKDKMKVIFHCTVHKAPCIERCYLIDFMERPLPFETFI